VQIDLNTEVDVMVSIASAPGHTCTTHADLIPVSRVGEVPSPDDAALCMPVSPGAATMVARDVPAGDYFLLIDGRSWWGTGGAFRPRSYNAVTGSFVVTLSTPAAVEEPPACADAREVDVAALATDGATVQVDVAPSELSLGDEATLYALPCTGPGLFSERVLTFVAPASGTLTASVGEFSWVTAMVLASGACDMRTQADLETCAIYGDLSAPVIEGERYWLLLDNAIYVDNPQTVTVTLSLAP
jgi:hypothetical protein